MARKGFNKQSVEAQVEAYNEAKAQVNDFGPRIRLNMGMNVLWVIPGIGNTKSFVHPVKIHYNPMHICGRVGKFKDPITGEVTDDRDFKKCFRCKSASDHWKAAGNPGKGDKNSKDPFKQAFKDDMPTDSGIIQAIDFTPFFIMKGRNPVFNEKYADLLPIYVKAVGGDEEALGQLEDEKMREAAKAGVSCVIVNNQLKDDLIDTERDVQDQFAQRAKKDKDLKKLAFHSDGLPMRPEAFLVYIDRSKDTSKTFTGRDGTDKNAYVNAVSFLTYDSLYDPDNDTSWSSALPLDELMDVALDNGIDLATPEEDMEDGVDLLTKALGFAKLTPEEMEAYLKECDHSFLPPSVGVGNKPAAPAAGDDGEAPGIEFSDPDAFDSDGANELIADAEKREAIKRARATMAATDDDDVEEEAAE
jgi:hypothetical protein